MISLIVEIERASAEILEHGRTIRSRTGLAREIIGLEIRFDFNKVLNESDPVGHPEFEKLIKAIKFPIQTLKRDSNSRRATIQLSDTVDDEEIDCLNIVQFLIRYGYLHVVVFARSLDVGRKLFDDVVAVGRVSARVLDELNLKPGLIRFYAGSAHVHV